jgi:transposase
VCSTKTNALNGAKEQPAMEYGASDLHMRRSQIRIVEADGRIVLERKIDTRRTDLTQVCGARPSMRILIESSTESEWVAQHLEGLGHEVLVADPNYAAMYGSRSRKVKTDKRDVAALTEANRTGVYRRAHRASAASQTLRQTLRVRAHLVQLRSRTISLLRALLRREGLRLPSGSAEGLLTRLDRLTVPPALVTVIAPLRAILTHVNESLAAREQEVEARAAADPTTQRLMTAPGVGPIVALTYQAVLDVPARFGGDAARASAFLGLVPSEDSSAERQHKGHITKTGPRDLRALLVQASWVIWRGRSAAGAALRVWAHALAARRGRRIAIIGRARRLSRILSAMWRDQKEFVARRQPVAVGA